MPRKTEQVPINTAYLRTYFRKNDFSAETVSINIGKSKKYIQNCLTRGNMEKTPLMFICSLTGMDYKEVTTVERPIEKKTEIKPISSAGVADVLGHCIGYTPAGIGELDEYSQDILDAIRNEALLGRDKEWVSSCRLALCSFIVRDINEIGDIITGVRNSLSDCADCIPIAANKIISSISDDIETVVSYIQDVGKINSDIVREVRDTRGKTDEALVKLNGTLTELLALLRSMSSENRQYHTNINNKLVELNNRLTSGK